MKHNEIPEEVRNKPQVHLFLTASVAFFALICSVSAFFFFQNSSLDSSIESRQNETVEYTKSIEKLGGDKRTVAAELVKLNKQEIEASIQVSEAQRYIVELGRISRTSGILFSGFSYANGKISTSAISIPDTLLLGDDGVQKVSKLVKGYRDAFTGSLFTLGPVLSIGGDEQKRTFSVDFTVGKSTIQ